MKSKGIVIKSIDYQESSKIVYLYTPNGKCSIKAIGALNPKKGLSGFTTTANIVSFVASESDFPKLEEYNLELSSIKFSNSIEEIEAIRIIIELIGYIPDDINHNSTYQFIEKTINDLSKGNIRKVISIFLIKMLYIFGVAPQLKSCIICGSKSSLIGFSITDGGATCSACKSANNTGLLSIWNEYYYDKKDISEYSEYDYKLLLSKINKYYLAHVHINLKLDLLIN